MLRYFSVAEFEVAAHEYRPEIIALMLLLLSQGKDLGLKAVMGKHKSREHKSLGLPGLERQERKSRVWRSAMSKTQRCFCFLKNLQDCFCLEMETMIIPHTTWGTRPSLICIEGNRNRI